MGSRGRFGRSGAAALVVGVASVVLVMTTLAPAWAAGTPAPFDNGTASATAIVTRFTPGVGSLPTGLFGGVALAKVTNQVAQAQAETLDLGLIGDLLSALDILPSVDQPAPLEVDNRSGPTSAAKDEYPVAGTTLGGGRKAVSADKVPSARPASSTLVSSYGDVVKVEGGRAEASTRIVGGNAREATATVTADLDIGGLVHLSGLRWTAVHRTGAGAHADASFSIDGGTIGTLRVPVGSLAGVEDAVNGALATTGISIRLPRVERQTTPIDVVRITPLEVRLEDSPAGKAALGPVLGLTREEREQLFDQLTSFSSDLGVPLLAADVATSILSGTGFISIDVGGAEASTAPSPVGPTLQPIPPARPAASGPLPTIPVLPATGVRPPGAPGTREGPVALGSHCESVHVDHPRPCSSGSLAPLGFAGMGVAAVVGLADVRHQRRRRARAVAGVLAAAVPSAVARRRALRGYLPLVAASGAFVLLAVAVGVPRAHPPYQGVLAVPVVRTPALDANGVPISGPLDQVGSVAPGPATAVGGVRPCPDRALQVPGDPYSPPCYAFSGDNGGATTRGVTKDTIKVSVRDVEDGSATDIFASLANQDIDTSDASAQDTLDTLAEYFSDHFQLYGRRLKIERFRGTGNGINELLDGDKAEAAADAVTASKEIGAFADLSGITLPYADALAQDGVLSFSAPYPSRAWFEARQPYAWNLFPDGTNVVSATTSAMIGRYPPGSLAEFAGPALRTHPRRFAIVAPENAEYQESMNVLIGLLKAAHIDVAVNEKYKLDLTSFPNQASNIIAQLKDDGVTSVVCMCDPAMLAFGLTPKADEQDYQPEWITAGLVFVDQDVVAQTIDSTQWSHAFGTAYNAVSERIGASYPYEAYKSVRPNDEPAIGVEELYYEMYLLVIGLQMAGPDLTPETFRTGMFAYPSAFGPRGTWDFGPGDYTPTNDYREIWWDPKRISAQDDKPGTWVQLDNGRRWSPQHPPHGRAPFFSEG